MDQLETLGKFWSSFLYVFDVSSDIASGIDFWKGVPINHTMFENKNFIEYTNQTCRNLTQSAPLNGCQLHRVL